MIAIGDPVRAGFATNLARPDRNITGNTILEPDLIGKSIDLALKDAFRKMRAFLMKTKELTEDEAISLISIAVDFGVTQVVDGNWGIHAIIKKNLFAGATV